MAIRQLTGKVGGYRWELRCNCGNIFSCSRGNLSRTNSCGCYARECARNRILARRKRFFEYKSTKAYRAWVNMRNRCTNANHQSYKNYGARGITVCEQWDEFEKFLEDMGQPADKSVSIERVNNQLGYSKENCIWASRYVQRRNSRQNRYLSYQGRKQIVSDWAEEFKLPLGTLLSRLDRMGWSVEKALTTPRRISYYSG